MTPDRIKRDAGVTLVELVISIALMSMLAAVISAAVVVTLRTSPAVADRADAAVNVQGLVTWLPQDIDSAEPGTFDISETAATGCAGSDAGLNLLKVTWSETLSSTVNYVASYRYVAKTGGGHIARVYCIAGAPPQVLKVSGLIPPWVAGSEPVTVVLSDSVQPLDGLVDSAKFLVKPLVGKMIVIDATTKNPNETLPTPTPTPTATPTPPTAPPPTPNLPPTAPNTSATIAPDTAVTVSMPASDPEGGALTVSVAPVPVGWTITTGPGASIVVTAPATAVGMPAEVLTYSVTDPAGKTAAGQLTIAVVSAPGPNQPPQTSPAAASTDAGDAVVIGLPATDPEGGALTAAFAGVPSGWTVTATGLSATITPASDALLGDFTIGYTATDPGGLSSTSTITVTVTGPPPCVISTPVISPPSVKLKNNNSDALGDSVDVTITLVGGYCVGLALHYDTGAPNGQYIRNFGNVGTTRTVTLPNHPSPELWSIGTKALAVRDGSSAVIGTVNLQVTR